MRLRKWLWPAAFAVVAALAVVRNLAGLSVSPPGLYVDESSIGYNAWAIAHYGVDEHGVHFPLFFAAFGEYKNPIYIYALVPFVRFLPLTPAVERLPAAFFGLLTIAFLTLAAWRVSRSHSIALFVLVLAALTPWITQQSRVGFEVVSMVTMLAAALWCIADERRLSPRRFALCGVFLAFAIFAYTVGRLEVLLLTLAFAAVYGTMRPRFHQWWLTLVPVVAGYLVLAVWGLLNPGGLTGHFGGISIAGPGGSLFTLAGRFLANYASYFSPDFLFVHGDLNPRHNTGFAGMLLAVTAPLLLLGLWTCWKRRDEALPRFVALGLVLSPIAAALTENGGEPHGLRSVTGLPFWLLLAVLGLTGLADLLRTRRFAAVAAASVLSAGLLAQGALYTVDLFTAYPVRAAALFDTGEMPGIGAAAAAVGAGHTIYLSSTLEQPYIDAFFALTPPPPAEPTGDDAGAGLRQLGMQVTDPALASTLARPGDLLVLWITDPRPARAVAITEEPAPTDPLRPGEAPLPLVTLYRAT